MERIVSSCLLIAAIVLSTSACSTKIGAYKVGAGQPRKGGIPFFAPRPVLQVNKAIEVKRNEELYALLSLAGTEQFLYKIDLSDFAQSINELKTLDNYSNKTIHIIPAPVESRIQTKAQRKTESSEHNISEDSDKPAEHQSSTVKKDKDKVQNLETLSEWTLPQSASESEDESLPRLYGPEDLEKAFEILLVPDTEKEYELVISPSQLASSKITVELADGWRLTKINAETGENQAITALKDVVSSLISATQAIRVAQISKEQAIELERIKAGSDVETQSGDQQDTVNVQVRIEGYLFKVDVEVLQPGLYDVLRSLGQASSFTLPTTTAAYWEKVDL